MNTQVRIAAVQSLSLVGGVRKKMEPLTNYHFARAIMEERQKPQLREQKNAHKRAKTDLVSGSIKAVFCEVDASLKRAQTYTMFGHE